MRPLPALEGGSTEGEGVIVTAGEKIVIQKGPPPLEADGKRKTDFPTNSKYRSLVGRKSTPRTLLRPFENGPGESLITESIMKTPI